MEDEVLLDLRREKGTFYLVIENKKATLSFSLTSGELIAESVFTPVELRGKGIAARLTGAMVDYAEKNGLKIYPVCPYVIEYFRKRPDLDGLLSPRYAGQKPVFSREAG